MTSSASRPAPSRRWFGVAIVVAAALAAGLACSGSTSAPAAGAKGTASPAPGTLAVGQEATVGQVAVTVTGARLVPPTPSLKPATGLIWIAVALRVRNTGTTPYTLATGLSLSLLDKRGHKLGQPAAQVIPRTLGGIVAPAGTLEGEVAYEVPADGAPFTVRFQQPFGTAMASWTVAVK